MTSQPRHRPQCLDVTFKNTKEDENTSARCWRLIYSLQTHTSSNQRWLEKQELTKMKDRYWQAGACAEGITDIFFIKWSPLDDLVNLSKCLDALHALQCQWCLCVSGYQRTRTLWACVFRNVKQRLCYRVSLPQPPCHSHCTVLVTAAMRQPCQAVPVTQTEMTEAIPYLMLLFSPPGSSPASGPMMGISTQRPLQARVISLCRSPSKIPLISSACSTLNETNHRTSWSCRGRMHIVLKQQLDTEGAGGPWQRAEWGWGVGGCPT